MPAGFTNDGLLFMLADSFGAYAVQVRLHYGDPGVAGTANQIQGTGYANQLVASGGFTREGATGAKYSNTADVAFTVSAGGAWGDGTNEQAIEWYSLWIDADDDAGSAPDTFVGAGRFSNSQTVRSGDPFDVQQRSLDLDLTDTTT